MAMLLAAEASQIRTDGTAAAEASQIRTDGTAGFRFPYHGLRDPLPQVPTERPTSEGRVRDPDAPAMAASDTSLNWSTDAIGREQRTLATRRDGETPCVASGAAVAMTQLHAA
jgi:hypothetical protein